MSGARAGAGLVAQARAIAALEWRIQRREPATVLYVLVFLLLTFGFVSSGTVELVRDRAALPKLSPLAITLALGGLTAFGQVITTMVVASAFLRDAAWRTDQLLFATPLDRRAWAGGRWFAALTVLALVSLALPAGVLLGAAAPWVTGDDAWLDVAGRALRAWATSTLPTVVAVGSLLAVAAVRTRRLLGVLAAALALLSLWQGCEAVRRAEIRGRVPPTLARVAALADPFGTVAVQRETAGWSDRERATRPVPWRGPVGGSRLLWLGGAVALGLLAVRAHVPVAAQVARSRDDGRVRADVGGVAAAGDRAAAGGGAVAVAGRRGWLHRHQLSLVARTTLTWTWRETGWRVIGLLGALNVLVHAVTAEAPAAFDAAGLLLLVREHARLFLILLATIYAGELVWRDQDDRVQALVASAPIASGTLVSGRVVGLAIAQGLLVALLVAAAVAGRLVGDWSATTRALPLVTSAWWSIPLGALLWLWLPFVQWLLLSLLVHVLVRHKVIAHLLLIAGWVAAVALDANGVSAWWIRFADPPALTAGLALSWPAATLRATWWSAVGAALLWLAVRAWPRLTSRR